MKDQIRRLVGVISPRLAGAAVCEACGNEFSCGVSLRGCWCASVELSDETRAELKTRYRDCLCRECLERLAAAAE
jgi:cysteine-rich CWC protein